MLLHVAYPHLAYFFAPLLILLVLYRALFYKTPVYQYALTKTLARNNLGQQIPHKKIFFMLRVITLTVLAFLILRPQWLDERSKVLINGIDIILAIDVSNSMILFDDLKDQRPRIKVAIDEALRFVEHRHNDAIGIVIFGKEAISWCPLTLDKHILKQILGKITLGIIDPHETWLGTGLATAVNRLRSSQAKSKVIILLTDGQPTPLEKIDPSFATDLAKKFGIKVYTIGIGSEEGGYCKGPFSSIMATGENTLNIPLLQDIAQKTGGKFFRAKNPADMRAIYDTIDRLEKTEHQTDIYHRYYEAFLWFMWIVLLSLGLELILRLLIWRGLGQ